MGSKHRNRQHIPHRKNLQKIRPTPTTRMHRHKTRQPTTKGNQHMSIPLQINQIKANNWNCNHLGTQEMQTLKQRLQQDGQEKTPPIIVRKITNDPCYEIIDGEHRWQIAKELGWTNINAIIQNIDDQQSKALCIIFNKLHGHLNWIKLYDVVKQDQKQGINLHEAYKNALSTDELDWLLSLDNLNPTMQTPLEDAIKKHPEISLEQIALVTQFPHDQQVQLVKKFQNSMLTHALNHVLNSFKATQKNTTQQQPPYPQNKTYNPDQTEQQQQTNTTQTPNQPQTEKEETNTTQQQTKQREMTTATMIIASYNCTCGRHYRINFENATITVEKQKNLYEKIDYTPTTYKIHCSKCNNNHEYTIKNPKKETVNIFCPRCKPHRQGILDTNTEKVTWID